MDPSGNNADKERARRNCLENAARLVTFCAILIGAIVPLVLSLTTEPWYFALHKVPRTNTTIRYEIGPMSDCSITRTSSGRSNTFADAENGNRTCKQSWDLLQTDDKIGVAALCVVAVTLAIALLLTVIAGYLCFGKSSQLHRVIGYLAHATLPICIFGTCCALFDGRLGRRADINWQAGMGQYYLFLGLFMVFLTDFSVSFGIHHAKAESSRRKQ